MAQTEQIKKLPKVWSALMAINAKNLTGVLTVHTEVSKAVIHVSNGKIVNLEAPDFSPDRVVEILHRMKVLSASSVVKIKKVARKEGISPTQATISLELAQEATVLRVQEFLLKEALLVLMMDETAEVTFEEELAGTIAYTVRMPIAFLLKEAQRRQKEWPAIKTKVPFMQAVFKRKPAVDPVSGQELPWEDLPIQGIDKIVYFFLDGKRTVSQIADSAFISEFDAARAIYSLLNRDLAIKLSYYQDEKEKDTTTKKNIKGVLAITMGYIIFLAMIALVGLGITHSWLNQVSPLARDPVKELIEYQSEQRLQTAMAVFKARNGRWPDDFNELLETKMALPVDKKAAMVTKKPDGSGYLYEGNEIK